MSALKHSEADVIERQPFNWKTPNYTEIFRQRVANLKRIREHPDCVPHLKQFYKANPAVFISDWGTTLDPRLIERGLPAVIPFVLFPRQFEWIEFVMSCWRNQEPGLTEKSRDMGVTWLAIELACTLCLFFENMSVGFGSRKEEYVDKIGHPKSIFWKGRFFMRHLPREFRGGWLAARDAPRLRLQFPESGSTITGEAGDNIGRGDRQGIYFVDEAQPLDSKILTPTGWQTMADMRVGSMVIGKDGLSHRVTHINDCGTHDVFRITFSDGTTAESSINHLWAVANVWGKCWTGVLRTHELAANYSYRSPGGQTQYRYRIPVCAPVRFAPVGRSLPLDPYLVGALLGDGSVKAGVVRITSADAEIVESFKKLLPDGVIVGAFDGKYSYNIVDELGRRGRAKGGLYIKSRARTMTIEAGIAGCNGPDKFVPDLYKFASPVDRLSLLQGLMDTDGSATGGAAAFHTSSLQLANDVRFLVQSLGGTATHNVKSDRRGYRDMHDVHLTLPNGMLPFRLTRKRDAMRVRQHPPGRTITAIEPIDRKPVRCITVASSDGLYLTDNLIVTHNSAHLERPELVEASLSETTNCRQDISSVNTMGNPFATKRWGGQVRVFIFDWREDPRKDQAWYDLRKARLDPVVLAQEIDRDYNAAADGIVIPQTWVRAAVDAHLKLGIKVTGAKGAALDVADEGKDLNAICCDHGILIVHVEEWSGKDSDVFRTTQRAFDVCDSLGIDHVVYDADGIGSNVRGDGRVINESRKAAGRSMVATIAFRGSAGVEHPTKEDVEGRTNEDFFANLKAQKWWSLRRQFQNTFLWVTEGRACDPDSIVSISSKIPKLNELCAELSQPTFKTNGAGKIVIDKMPNAARSPNLADSVMMKKAGARRGTKKIGQALLRKI